MKNNQTTTEADWEMELNDIIAEMIASKNHPPKGYKVNRLRKFILKLIAKEKKAVLANLLDIQRCIDGEFFVPVGIIEGELQSLAHSQVLDTEQRSEDREGKE